MPNYRNNRNMRRTRKNRRTVGGGSLNPMELTDTSMRSATNMSLAQGGDFANIHKEQHGGMAPVGYTGVLDESLRGSARVLPIDDSIRQIQGLSDQTGGKRRNGRKGSRKGRKAKKATRKSKKASRKGSRKNRKQTERRRRNMTGGMRELGYMDANAPGMLLPPSLAAKALSNMNYEWKLAENPSSFAPKGF
jgi:hypothetical protein